MIASEETRTGLAPLARLGASAGLDAEFGAPDPFRSAARLEVDWAEGAVSGARGAAKLALITGRLSACPLRLRPRGDVSLRPCAEIEVGALWATDSTAAVPKSAAEPWLSVGAVVRARWVARDGLFVEVAGGIALPIVRSRFFFEPDAVVYTVPPVTGRVAIGPGFRF